MKEMTYRAKFSTGRDPILGGFVLGKEDLAKKFRKILIEKHGKDIPIVLLRKYMASIHQGIIKSLEGKMGQTIECLGSFEYLPGVMRVKKIPRSNKTIVYPTTTVRFMPTRKVYKMINPDEEL